MWRLQLATLTLITAVGPLIPAKSFAETEIGNDAESMWFDCIDPLFDAQERRLSCANAGLRRLRQQAIALASDEAIKVFIEEVTSLTSQAKQATNNKTWETWVRERYIYHVVPKTAFVSNILAELKRLDEEMRAIDSEVLIQLGIDMEYSGELLDSERLSFKCLDEAIDQTVRKIVGPVQEANVEAAARAAGGFVVGAAAQNAAADAMRDEAGELSWSGFIGSVLVGIAVEEAADAVVQSVSETDSKLRSVVFNATVALFKSYTHAGKACDQQMQQLIELVLNHEGATMGVVAKALGFERDWAFNAYIEAREKRYAAKK